MSKHSASFSILHFGLVTSVRISYFLHRAKEEPGLSVAVLPRVTAPSPNIPHPTAKPPALPLLLPGDGDTVASAPSAPPCLHTWLCVQLSALQQCISVCYITFQSMSLLSISHHRHFPQPLPFLMLFQRKDFVPASSAQANICLFGVLDLIDTLILYKHSKGLPTPVLLLLLLFFDFWRDLYTSPSLVACYRIILSYSQHYL